MISLILFFCAFTVVAFTAGRLYERQMVSIRRGEAAEEERVTRPWVTVTDAGPAELIAFTREVLLEEDPPTGRHDPRVVRGSSAQRARWHQITHEFHALVGGTWSAEERADLEAVAT